MSKHREHRNKYAPRPAIARVWCDAANMTGGHCQLVADHPGPHVYAARKR